MTRQRTFMCVALALSLGTQGVAQESGRELKVTIRGTVLLNGFYNSRRVNNSDVPTVVAVPAQAAPRAGSLGGTVRQTRLILSAQSAEVLGGRFASELDVDFFGGQQPSSGGRTHPLPRIRRAYGELTWRHATLLVGQEAPPLCDVNPSSLAGIGLPLFASSGNLWLWLPQIRVTGWSGSEGSFRLGFSGAVVAPSAGEPQDPFLTQPDRAEASQRPALEGRVIARWRSGSGRRTGEIGVGGHVGWLATSAGPLIVSRAVALGLTAPFGRWVEVRGELFRGRGLGGLGGGGIGQTVQTDGLETIRTKGGWGQLIVFPATGTELSFGVGADDPDDVDLDGATARTRNVVWALGAQARRAPVLLGLELRRLSTSYLGPGQVGPFRTTHLNLGAGFEF